MAQCHKHTKKDMHMFLKYLNNDIYIKCIKTCGDNILQLLDNSRIGREMEWDIGP